MKWLIPLVAALAGGCGVIPKDQDGTLERVRQFREVRVGLVATGSPPAQLSALHRLAERSAAAAGARATIRPDSAEKLLLQLEEGELDLVIGEFDQASPWSRRVHLLPPLATRQILGRRLETTAAARNGENAWIMLVEREARALANAS